MGMLNYIIAFAVWFLLLFLFISLPSYFDVIRDYLIMALFVAGGVILIKLF